jgi:hypothetical protein
MPIMFTSILKAAGIDPPDVRLLRHQDTRADRDLKPYKLWREKPDDFMVYQSRQSPRSEKLMGSAKYWAAFVVTPNGETLFVGLYAVLSKQPGRIGVPNVSKRDAVEGEHVVYDLQEPAELSEFVDKLTIDWGAGFLAWAQRADKNDKQIIELRREFQEEKFPGNLRFIEQLSKIEALPGGWIGIYILTCPRTKEQYVGSARGSDGFYQRWMQHASVGGDAIRLKSRELSDYHVSILEVAGSGASDDEIFKAEQLWIRKLQSMAMGLNGNPISPVKSEPAA